MIASSNWAIAHVCMLAEDAPRRFLGSAPNDKRSNVLGVAEVDRAPSPRTLRGVKIAATRPYDSIPERPRECHSRAWLRAH
jgi:hypothetical protein